MGEADDGGARVARVELQMLRLRLLLSGEELAQKAGIALSTYQRIERGEQNPHPKTMRGLALALGVDE
ncbi:MAG: helix-turn-helix transcriptional regulator, partial [Pseudonocardia sp.]|nr:helix-turn-helix transcriptional regulator [Pseudonocardia sp.]